MKITVVIDRYNAKEAHDTNSSISSVSGNKEETKDNKFVCKELETHRFDWHTPGGPLERFLYVYDDDTYINKSTG